MNPRACYWAVIQSRWDALFIQHRDKLSRAWLLTCQKSSKLDQWHSSVPCWLSVNNCDHLAPCDCVSNQGEIHSDLNHELCVSYCPFLVTPSSFASSFQLCLLWENIYMINEEDASLSADTRGWLKGRLHHTKCMHSCFFWSLGITRENWKSSNISEIVYLYFWSKLVQFLIKSKSNM